MPTHISLTGEADVQLKELKDKLGGTLPQIVRQAIKLLHSQYFPPKAPTPPLSLPGR